MKKKYFCDIVFIFFGILVFGMPVLAYESKLSQEDLAKIQEIKAHNKQQMEQRLTLDKYQKQHPNTMTPQPEEYWDLAWHARLADYGDEESQFVIARAYDKGQQVDQNPKKAIAFYEKAADQGHIDACMRLGEIYAENKWVKKDDEKSLYWYAKAAKNGYVQAQLKVSEIYKRKGDYLLAVLYLETGLKQLFPQAENVDSYAPDLVELKRLAKIQKKMNERGVHKTVLHENGLTAFKSKRLHVPLSATRSQIQPFKPKKRVVQGVSQ